MARLGTWGTWGTWLAALGLAVLLPPLGVWLARRRGPAVWISGLGCGAAVGAFVVMAGAGVVLWGLAIVHGVITVAGFGLRRQGNGVS